MRSQWPGDIHKNSMGSRSSRSISYLRQGRDRLEGTEAVNKNRNEYCTYNLTKMPQRGIRVDELIVT